VWRTERAYRASLTRFAATAAIGDEALESTLAAVHPWYSRNGTLTRRALDAIVNECAASGDGLTSDCRDAVNEGDGNFQLVPADARREFVKLFDDSCPANVLPEACFRKMRSLRLFRALARARLDPQPLTMNEGVRTRFTARLRDSGMVQGVPGARTDLGIERDSSAPGGQRTVEVIPYSEHMCFRLTAEDPNKARIEPVPAQGASIVGDKLCMDMNEGGAEIKYEPSWFVTPLSGNDLNLLLDAEYDVEGVKRLFQFQPRPIKVDVIPKPGFWDRLDAFLERATGTANLATGLAKAIGTLIAVVAAWGIWGWFKRKRSGAPPRSRRRRDDRG